MPLPKPLKKAERDALSKAAIIATQRLRTLMYEDPHLIINSSHGAERMAQIIDEAFAKYPPATHADCERMTKVEALYGTGEPEPWKAFMRDAAVGGFRYAADFLPALKGP